MIQFNPVSFALNDARDSIMGADSSNGVMAQTSIGKSYAGIDPLSFERPPLSTSPQTILSAEGLNGQSKQPMPSGLHTIGDQILNSIERMSTNLNQNLDAIKPGDFVSPASLSVTDYLRLQHSVFMMSITVDLGGKIISRSTQNLDQLMRTT